MTDDNLSSPKQQADDAPSLAVKCVRAMMERHGLPRYRQSAWLAEATGLSYSQAHRRMNGGSAWTLEELERVGSLFGESLSQVVSLGADPTSIHGTMTVGSAVVPCMMWLGEPVPEPRADEIVAVETEGRWVAVCARDSAGGPMYRVQRLDIRPAEAGRPTIAVLDDDHDVADTVCAHLATQGYEARAFYRTGDLQSSARARTFDGYVIDWLVGESSAERLIANLRSQDASAPIVVLTAQVEAGVVDESDIAAAVKRHNLVFSEKPVRMSILSATLNRAFASAAPAATAQAA